MHFFSKLVNDIISLVVKTDVKQEILDSIKVDEFGTHYFDRNGTMFTFPRDSWEMARRAGIADFVNVLKKLHQNTFKILDYISRLHYVESVRVSSTWRPGDINTNIHTIGRAIDIGEIIFVNENVFYNRSIGDRKNETEQAKRFRFDLFESGLLNQWIGPWWIKYSSFAPWNINDGRPGVPEQHLNHIHLTIKG